MIEAGERSARPDEALTMVILGLAGREAHSITPATGEALSAIDPNYWESHLMSANTELAERVRRGTFELAPRSRCAELREILFHTRTRAFLLQHASNYPRQGEMPPTSKSLESGTGRFGGDFPQPMMRGCSGNRPLLQMGGAIVTRPDVVLPSGRAVRLCPRSARCRTAEVQAPRLPGTPLRPPVWRCLPAPRDHASGSEASGPP